MNTVRRQRTTYRNQFVTISRHSRSKQWNPKTWVKKQTKTPGAPTPESKEKNMKRSITDQIKSFLIRGLTPTLLATAILSLAGMAKMPWRTFLFYDLTGAAAYTITYKLAELANQ